MQLTNPPFTSCGLASGIARVLMGLACHRSRLQRWTEESVVGWIQPFAHGLVRAPRLLDPFSWQGNITWAHGVVVSHPLSMREALGSIPSVSMSIPPFLAGQLDRQRERQRDRETERQRERERERDRQKDRHLWSRTSGKETCGGLSGEVSPWPICKDLSHTPPPGTQSGSSAGNASHYITTDMVPASLAYRS